LCGCSHEGTGPETVMVDRWCSSFRPRAMGLERVVLLPSPKPCGLVTRGLLTPQDTEPAFRAWARSLPLLVRYLPLTVIEAGSSLEAELCWLGGGCRMVMEGNACDQSLDNEKDSGRMEPCWPSPSLGCLIGCSGTGMTYHSHIWAEIPRPGSPNWIRPWIQAAQMKAWAWVRHVPTAVIIPEGLRATGQWALH
jgi:hypothetical protein